MSKLIHQSWKEQNVIERIPLSCQNIPEIILLIQSQTRKNGYTKGCSRDCHLCYRERCA